MYTLQRLNVVKVVPTEAKRDELLSKGFELLPDPSSPASPDPKQDMPLDKKTLDELKALAVEKGIEVADTDTKAVILEKIKEAEQGK